MGQNIFISYRRVDTEGYAGRIYDRLAERFGSDRVFVDVTDIRVGEDFADAIGQAINSCRVVIVLMGPQWHTVSDEMGRQRLDDPHDFVHLEVKSALDRNILVIPVLVHGAKMPKASDLPFDLAGLLHRNAIEIRHRRFDIDVEYLVTELERYFVESDQVDLEMTGEKLPRRIPVWGWPLTIFLLIVMGVIGSRWFNSKSNNPMIMPQGAIELTLTMITQRPGQITNTDLPLSPTETATEFPPATILPPVAKGFPTASPPPLFPPEETPLAAQMIDSFGVAMVLVHQGPFMMGTDGRDPWDVVARPAHLVSLDMYYIDKFEVSNAQYTLCVFEGACEAPLLTGSKMRHSYYADPLFADYPVVQISWYQAQDYCAWRMGHLPSEAEWEKAARGADQYIYPWGTDQVDCQTANFWPTGACEGDTTSVKKQSAGASPYGAFNMSGNVAEWVQDWFQAYPNGDPKAAKDFGVTHRIIRGGAYFDGPNNIRSTARKGMSPEESHSYIGFRCVLEIEALP